MSDSPDAASIGVEIERLVARLDALGDSPGRAEAQELVRLLLSFHGSGLSRILDVVRTEQGGPPAALDRLARDPLVSSLLVLHDLHPERVEVRVSRALTALQAHLAPGTELRLVAVEGDAARVRVDGPPGRGSAAGMRGAVERAVQEAAPEVATIHLEGLDSSDALIQIVRRPAGMATPNR